MIKNITGIILLAGILGCGPVEKVSKTDREIAQKNYAKHQEEKRKRQEEEIGYVVQLILKPAKYFASKKDNEVVWTLEEEKYYLRLNYYDYSLPDKMIEVPKDVFNQAKEGDAWLKGKLFPKPEIK